MELLHKDDIAIELIDDRSDFEKAFLIDEAAKINMSISKIKLSTVLTNVVPTLDKSKGQLILISTTDGMNLFYDYYMKGKHGQNNFCSFFFSCWDDPTFSVQDREDIVRDFGEDHAIPW